MRRHALRAILVVACIFASLPQSAGAAATACAIEDLMPAYFAFEQRTRALPAPRRAELFVSQFAAEHPDFFSREAFGDKEKLRKASLRLLDPNQPEQLPGFAPLTSERFHAVAAAAAVEFGKAEAKLRATFRDYGCDAPIGFGPSFLRFDGHGYEGADGRTHMLFGIDTIATLHGPKDMPAFFVHELFHLYHEHVLGTQIPPDDSVVWWGLWKEGLATYVSQRLDPSLSAQQVLWFPADIVAQMEAPGVFERAARLLLRDFDKADETYTQWFTSGDAVSGLPPRAGYYMGYRLAAALGKEHSLVWLAHLPPAHLKIYARTFLETGAKGSSGN